MIEICSGSQAWTIYNIIIWTLAGIGLISILLFLIKWFMPLEEK